MSLFQDKMSFFLQKMCDNQKNKQKNMHIAFFFFNVGSALDK